MARNYWLRLIGANIASALFILANDALWQVVFSAHCLVVLALMLLTSPEKNQ
jgi:hypothetical protein